MFPSLNKFWFSISIIQGVYIKLNLMMQSNFNITKGCVYLEK